MTRPVAAKSPPNISAVGVYPDGGEVPFSRSPS